MGGYLAYNHFLSNDDISSVSATADEEEKKGKAPSVAEAEKIAKKTYEDMLSAKYEAGEGNSWYSGDIDYDLFAEVMGPYVTEDFYAELSSLDPSALYCQCDSVYLISLDFESRTKVIDVQTDTIKVRTLSIDAMLNDSMQAFLDFKRVDGKWKVHRYSLVNANDKPLNLTKEEAERYLANLYPGNSKYLKEINYAYDDRIVHAYLFYVEDVDHLYAIHSDDGFMNAGIPEGLVPKEWREKLYEFKY